MRNLHTFSALFWTIIDQRASRGSKPKNQLTFKKNIACFRGDYLNFFFMAGRRKRDNNSSTVTRRDVQMNKKHVTTVALVTHIVRQR